MEKRPAPLPRNAAMGSLGSGTILMTFPSTIHWTLDSGSMLNRLRISAGIETWPRVVTFAFILNTSHMTRSICSCELNRIIPLRLRWLKQSACSGAQALPRSGGSVLRRNGDESKIPSKVVARRSSWPGLSQSPVRGRFLAGLKVRARHRTGEFAHNRHRVRPQGLVEDWYRNPAGPPVTPLL